MKNTATFSDDPAAGEKLAEKIDRLQKRQGLMKSANQLVRKGDREGLADLGFFRGADQEAVHAGFLRPHWLRRLRDQKQRRRDSPAEENP